MKSVVTSIVAVIVAILLLIVFWFIYGSSFNGNFNMFSSEEACLEQLKNTEDNMVSEFKERALDAIGRKGFGEALPTPTTFDNWKPSFKTFQIFLDPNAIIDLAVSRIRKAIAEDQELDPTSLLNTQIKVISDLFDKAEIWCTKLPNNDDKPISESVQSQ